MQILYLSGTALDVAEWRMLAPANAMSAAGERGEDWKAKMIHVSGFANYLDPVIQDHVGPSDLIIFQRNLVTEEVFDAIQYWQGMGKPVAADLDDAYQILPWSNPAHKFWVENPNKMDPPPLQMLEKGLSMCDALISPNRVLLSDWQHVVQGYYLQNFAREEWWNNLPSRAERKKELGLEDRVVIGWGGSISHYDSWWGSGIREAAAELCRKHPEVLWLICGNDMRIHDQLPVPLANKQQQVGVPPSEWPKVVRTFDIGVAPLFGIYDQRRSWIKGLEYGLAGVPWIATGGEPYRDMASLGTLIHNGANAWYTELTRAVESLASLQVQSEARIPVFQHWFIGNQLPTLRKVYSEIIGRFIVDHGRLPGLTYVNWDSKPKVEAREERSGE